MRQSLFVLILLASLPAAMVHAEPYATYNPLTGDVVLKELRGQARAVLSSTSGLLRTSVLSETPEIIPPDAQLPNMGSASAFTERFGIVWLISAPLQPKVPFDFDSLTFAKAVPPWTPVADLAMFAGDDIQRQIFVIPEPSAIALLGVVLLSLAALRRRK